MIYVLINLSVFPPSTLITDTMSELNMYSDDMKTKLGPLAKDTAERLGKEVQLLVNKLQAHMAEAKDRTTVYTLELQTMLEQNANDVSHRVNTYSRKLNKRLSKDTQEICRCDREKAGAVCQTR